MKVVSCILIGWSAALSKHEAFSHFTSFMRVVHFASPAQSWAIPPRSFSRSITGYSSSQLHLLNHGLFLLAASPAQSWAIPPCSFSRSIMGYSSSQWQWLCNDINHLYLFTSALSLIIFTHASKNRLLDWVTD
jgi:hypothetical protein